MKRMYFAYFSLFVLLAGTGCAGNAPLTEAQRAQMQYEREAWRAQFIEDRAECRARWGTIIVDHATFLDRDGVPRVPTVYTCTKIR
jgi:hypothetical protein